MLKEQPKIVPPLVFVEVETQPATACTIFTNFDEQNNITDYSQGITICLGEDRKGYGVVPICMTQYSDHYEQFSAQAEFRSES